MDFIQKFLDIIPIRIVDDLDDPNYDNRSIHRSDRHGHGHHHHRPRDARRDRHSLESKIERLKAENKDLNRTIKGLQRQLVALNEEMDAERRRSEELESERVALAQQNAELENKYERLIDDIGKKIDNLERGSEEEGFPRPLSIRGDLSRKSSQETIRTSSRRKSQSSAVPPLPMNGDLSRNRSRSFGDIRDGHSRKQSSEDDGHGHGRGGFQSRNPYGSMTDSGEPQRVNRRASTGLRSAISEKSEDDSFARAPNGVTRSKSSRKAKGSLDDREELARRLHEKEEEVRSLELYLNKTDQFTGADVTGMVSDLNAEIERFAADVIDFVKFEKPGETEYASVLEVPEDVFGGTFGEEVIQTLIPSDFDHSTDPTLIQVAIEAWEVHCCGELLKPFCLGMDSDRDEFLSGIYSHVRRGETQPAAARWRSLTLEYTRNLQKDVGTTYYDSLQQSVELNIKGLAFILCFAGCIEPFRPDASLVESMFKPKIEWILHMTTQIATVIREKVMSTNFELVSAAPTTLFDPASMEDFSKRSLGQSPVGTIDPSSVMDAGTPIVCTVGFGLTSTSKLGNANAAESGASVFDSRLLVKPRVVLPAIVQLLKSEADS